MLLVNIFEWTKSLRTNQRPEHPGGAQIIYKWAGKDATEVNHKGKHFDFRKLTDISRKTYEPIHPPDTLDKYLDKSKHLGDVDMGTVKKEKEETDEQEIKRQDAIAHMPILEQCYNLMDFESVARRVMKKTAWAYYSSGADDEIVSRPSLGFDRNR